MFDKYAIINTGRIMYLPIREKNVLITYFSVSS